MHRWPVATAAALMFAALAASCTQSERRKEHETSAISEFHRLLSARDIEGIYESADPSLKKAMTFQQVSEMLEPLLHSCGNARDFKLVDRRRVQYGNSGEIDVFAVTVDTSYANGTVREQFLFNARRAEPMLIAFKYKSGCMG